MPDGLHRAHPQIGGPFSADGRKAVHHTVGTRTIGCCDRADTEVKAIDIDHVRSELKLIDKISQPIISFEFRDHLRLTRKNARNVERLCQRWGPC